MPPSRRRCQNTPGGHWSIRLTNNFAANSIPRRRSDFPWRWSWCGTAGVACCFTHWRRAEEKPYAASSHKMERRPPARRILGTNGNYCAVPEAGVPNMTRFHITLIIALALGAMTLALGQFFLFASMVVAFLIVAGLGVALPQLRFFGPFICRGTSTPRCVARTFAHAPEAGSP